jgi:nitrous oxidase accessory protein NosD
MDYTLAYSNTKPIPGNQKGNDHRGKDVLRSDVVVKNKSTGTEIEGMRFCVHYLKGATDEDTEDNRRAAAKAKLQRVVAEQEALPSAPTLKSSEDVLESELTAEEIG